MKTAMNTEPSRKPIESSKVLIVGLVRNCANVIASEIDSLTKSFSEFAATRWLIIESDSTDETVQVLDRITNGEDIDYITLGALQAALPQRTVRIARCRNAYLEALNTDDRYADIDFVAVADLDGVNSLLTPEAVRSCWDIAIDWDACFANQSGPYYDIWALRHRDWSPNDCWRQFAFLQSQGMSRNKAIYAAVYSKMIHIPQDSPPLVVDSAFGGLGIYKRHLFEGCRYEGVDSEGDEICEHVGIHKSMRDKGVTLIINPKLINSDYNEFSQSMLKSHRIRGALREGARGMLAKILPASLLGKQRALRNRG